MSAQSKHREAAEAFVDKVTELSSVIMAKQETSSYQSAMLMLKLAELHERLSR